MYLAVRLERKIEVEMMSATGAEAAPTNLAKSIASNVTEPTRSRNADYHVCRIPDLHELSADSGI
jgi:hypothetical protein